MRDAGGAADQPFASVRVADQSVGARTALAVADANPLHSLRRQYNLDHIFHLSALGIRSIPMATCKWLQYRAIFELLTVEGAHGKPGAQTRIRIAGQFADRDRPIVSRRHPTRQRPRIARRRPHDLVAGGCL